MGSRNLKAIAVKGTGMPNVADLPAFKKSLSAVRDVFNGLTGVALTGVWREAGTAAAPQVISDDGLMAV